MLKKIIIRSLRSRAGLYIPMIIAISVTLWLIGAAVIIGDSFQAVVDKQMAKYGANVILKSPSKDAAREGVPIEVRQTERDGESVRLALTSIAALLDQNPAWLVRGDGTFLVGQKVASRLSLEQGDQITIDGKTGRAALLKSGTQFDEYIFTNGRVDNPSLGLIRSESPGQYRGSNAVILSEMVKSRYAVLQSVGRLMLIIAILSSIASIATVINLARVDAGRRQQEFGIFKSLGSTGGRIGRIIGSEYLVLSGVAILIGVSGSLGLSWGILHFVSGTGIEWNIGNALYITTITLIAFGSAGITYYTASKRHMVVEELRGV